MKLLSKTPKRSSGPSPALHALLGVGAVLGMAGAITVHRKYGDPTAVPERLARYHPLNPGLTMTYKDSVSIARSSAPRPAPGSELPISGSVPLSSAVRQHMTRLGQRTRTWAEQVQRVVADTHPAWKVTSMIRPHRAHFSMHELGRAIDFMLPGPLSGNNVASVSALIRNLQSARLVNMIYYGQTRNGNTVVHVEVHDLTLAGTPTYGLFINNGRHDEWLR